MPLLRHTTFSANLMALIAQLGENARDTNEALGERLIGRVARVSQYAATGATTTKVTLPISLQASPWGVLLVRAFPTADPAADVTVTGRVNFAQSGDTLSVYEPSGLIANTLYDLTFLILE